MVSPFCYVGNLNIVKYNKGMGDMKINIVMVEPEIPQNTGNIARTCAAIGAKLHLVKPLGFEITDKYLKRAGLDYWDKLNIEEHDSLNSFLEKYKPEENNMFFSTTKGQQCYSDMNYSKYEEVFNMIWERNKRITRGFAAKIYKKYNSYSNERTFKIIKFIKLCCNSCLRSFKTKWI